jgi:hypothetical protein
VSDDGGGRDGGGVHGCYSCVAVAPCAVDGCNLA